MTIHVMPEGTTAPQRFTLSKDGETIEDLDDLESVAIEVYDKNQVLMTGMGEVEIEGNEVVFTPNAAKWKATRSPYSVRWVLTGDDGVFKIPNGVFPDVWQVPKP